MAQQRLTILAIAYVYPPDAGSGTYRTLYFTNNWAQHGDTVTVVTVKEKDFSASALVDRTLCEQMASSVTVVRASAFRPLDRLIGLRNRCCRDTTNRLSARSSPGGIHAELSGVRKLLGLLKDTASALLTFPDAHIGWVPDAVRRGLHAAHAQRLDCIYASGGPWSCLLAATVLHILTRVPLILDFRDPWASNPGLELSSRLLRRAHALLESFCLRNAARVITNTAELRSDFVARYPQICPDRFVSVTNGFEDVPDVRHAITQRFTLLHAGELYLSRNPHHFLRAVANLVDDGSIPRAELCVKFVGGVSTLDNEVASALRSLTDVVDLIPRVSHAEALQMQQTASALVLFQAGFPLQVPRKLYEYLSLKRPILAITEPDSATARILRDLGSHQIAPDDADSIGRSILSLYQDWKLGTIFRVNNAKLDNYSNRQLADKVRQEMLLVMDSR